jgi:hypothetical protein
MASRGAAQDILSLIQHDQTPTAADERAHEASCRERQFLDAENRAQIPPRLRPSGEARLIFLPKTVVCRTQHISIH